MGKKRKITAVLKFFGLPQSKRVSFKVADTSKKNKSLPNAETIPYDAIEPREQFNDEFDISLNSTQGRPRIFTPEQTYNYKSAWKRYQKGLELVEKELVLKDPQDPNKYKAVSPNSPKGYWEIEKKSTPPPRECAALHAQLIIKYTGYYFPAQYGSFEVEDKLPISNLTYIKNPTNDEDENALYYQTRTDIIPFPVKDIQVESFTTRPLGYFPIVLGREYNQVNAAFFVKLKVINLNDTEDFYLFGGIAPNNLVFANVQYLELESATIDFYKGKPIYPTIESTCDIYQYIYDEMGTPIDVDFNFPTPRMPLDPGTFVAGTSGDNEVIQKYNTTYDDGLALDATAEVTDQINDKYFIAQRYADREKVTFDLFSDAGGPFHLYPTAFMQFPLLVAPERFTIQYSESVYLIDVNNGFAKVVKIKALFRVSDLYLNDYAVAYLGDGTITEDGEYEDEREISFFSSSFTSPQQLIEKRLDNRLGLTVQPPDFTDDAVHQIEAAGTIELIGLKYYLVNPYSQTYPINSYADFTGVVESVTPYPYSVCIPIDYEEEPPEEPEEPPNEEDGESEWQCNCPDSSKKRELNPNNTSSNEPAEEDWTNSDAGAQDGECKHIWAVKILRGEVAPEDIPTDMPIEEDKEIDNFGDEQPKIIFSSNSGFGKWRPEKQKRRSGDKFL